jgi:hypothetical protein
MQFTNGSLLGIRHSEWVILEQVPRDAVIRSSVSVFRVSKALGWLAGLGLGVLLLLLLAACQGPQAQKGGAATTQFARPGHTSAATLLQSDNPKEPSKQTVQSEQTVEYVLPPGTAVGLGTGMMDYRTTGLRDDETTGQRDDGPGGRAVGVGRSELGGGNVPSAFSHLPSAPAAGTAVLNKPMPVRFLTRDRTETTIGGAQKDTLREWAGKAANLQPVMWAGIAMMTLIAGVLIYFGWWTKAAVAIGVGIAMVVLAQILPDHGGLIVLGGFGVFGLVALLILYAYYKGQLDQNHNGTPDFLEKKTSTAG